LDQDLGWYKLLNIPVVTGINPFKKEIGTSPGTGIGSFLNLSSLPVWFWY
jgi:hypothetical protein